MQHPGSLHEHRLTEGQSSESYVNPPLCVFEKLAYKVGKFQKTMAEFLRFVVAVLIDFSLRQTGSLNEHSLTEGQSSERVT